MLELASEVVIARLTRLAAELLDAPVVLVARLQEDRLVPEGGVGLADPATDGGSVPSALRLCQRVLETGAPLVLDEAGASAQGGEVAIAAFLGIPLHAADGSALGALCALDRAPRTWGALEVERLQALAALFADSDPRRGDGPPPARPGAALSGRAAVYRDLVEGAGDLMYRTDRLGRFTYVNPAAVAATGYAEDELLGMHFSQVVRADYRERLTRGLNRQLDEAVPAVYHEFPLRARDGRELWIGHNVQLLREGDAIVGVQGVARDISEQRAMEQALRESEERFRTVVESLGEGLVITDLDDVIVYANSRMVQLVGAEPEDLLGHRAYEVLFSAEEWARAREELERRKQGIPSCYEVQHTRRDGVRLWFEINAVPYRNADGEIVGTLALVQDIGARRLAEEALRESEARFRAVFESSAYGIAVLSPDGRFLDVNQAVEQKFGFTATEMARMTLAELTHPDDRPGGEVLRQQLLAGRQPYYVREQRLRHRSGHHLWIRLGISVVHDAAGEPQYLIAVGLDVTRQKQGEQALRESEERYRLMVEGSQQVFFYMHDVEHRFEYLSPSVRAVLGYEPEELIGRSYEVLLTGDESDEEVNQRTDQALQSGVGFSSYTVLTRHKDGRTVPVEVVETPIRRDGRTVGMQGFARDIAERHRAKEALERSEQYFRSLTENALDIIHVINADGTTRYLSPSVSRVLGYDPEERIGERADRWIHPEDTAQILETLRSIRPSGEPRSMEFRVLHRNGEWRIFEGVMRNLLDDPVVAGVVINSRDITERRRAEEANQRLAALSRENPSPVLECDERGEPVHVNPAAERIWRELRVESIRGLLPENHEQLVQSSLASGQGFQNVEATVADRIFSWTYRPLPDAGVVYLFAIDITGRRLMEEQLRHDALHDALTGLPNRLLFLERLAHAILRTKRRESYLFAVLFLDLDRFKVINDSLGHHVGDELLVVIARRLKGCLRPEDTVARLGGDEFAILLEDIGEVSDATRIAERIQAELTVPVNLNGFDVFTSASIGIALSSTSYERPEYLLRNADMAMYRAKATGQARFEVFDRAMHAQALTRLQLETDLRRALERNEFSVYYQPIISLATGRLCGMEALIRWDHPDRGQLAPGDFIPVAEETGVILPMGELVLREACRQVREWRDTYPDHAALSVGVNLSAKQLSQTDLVEQVGSALRETGLSPDALRLEITESAVMENPEAAGILLGRLKALGVHLLLDDFGTGYSSLSYLHYFPLDALKIDRSFIGRMSGAEGGTQLVQTVLTLARSLGVSVVAEGIETQEQLGLLRTMECPLGQGYLFARPMHPAGMEELLREDPEW